MSATQIAGAITERARAITGGEYAALFLRVEGSDPPIFVPQAVVGAPSSLFPALDEVDPDRLRFGGIFRPLFTGGTPQFVPDVAAEAERHGFPAGHPAIGSYIAHALLDSDGRVLGCLLVGDPRPGAFTEEHFQLVGALAEQAGLAVQNLWLYARSQRALRESETLRFIGQQLAGQVEIDALINQLVRHARAILDADLAVVAASAADGGQDRVATVGFESERFQHGGFEPGKGSAARVLEARAPVTLDVAAHPEEFPLLAAEGVRVAFGVPLISAGEAFGGLIVGYRRPMVITEHETALAQALAAHASISLENARLLAHAEARASQAEAERRLLRTVLESLPVGIVIVDAAGGRVTEVNRMAADILGRSIAGLALDEVGRVLDFHRPDGVALAHDDRPMVRALGLGETVTGAELTIAAPGGTLPLLVNAAPVPGPDGRPVAGVIAFQDVSHLKEVERLKDEFLSIASHELKTPLTPLLGLTQLMLRGLERGRPPSPEQLAANLRSIQRQAQHMSELVNDLLDVSRIQQGRLEIHPQEMDIVALAADVLDRFLALQTPEDPRRLRLEAPVQSLGGRWDRARIDQVLTNLIANALKYSPADTEVRVGVEPADDGVRMIVRDRGIGIPRDDLPRLFEPFYRASNAGVRNYPGVGLGLHITREIVHLHGGQIRVESIEGEGSTFVAELPWEAAPSPTA